MCALCDVGHIVCLCIHVHTGYFAYPELETYTPVVHTWQGKQGNVKGVAAAVNSKLHSWVRLGGCSR